MKFVSNCSFLGFSNLNDQFAVSLKRFLSNSYDLHFASLPTLSSALSLLSQMSTTSLSLMLVNGSYCALYAVRFTISSRYEHHGKVEVCVNGKSLGLNWKLWRV
ncbi:hypothetical protein ACFX19_035364 [Malus domestica]